MESLGRSSTCDGDFDRIEEVVRSAVAEGFGSIRELLLHIQAGQDAMAGHIFAASPRLQEETWATETPMNTYDNVPSTASSVYAPSACSPLACPPSAYAPAGHAAVDRGMDTASTVCTAPSLSGNGPLFKPLGTDSSQESHDRDYDGSHAMCRHLSDPAAAATDAWQNLVRMSFPQNLDSPGTPVKHEPSLKSLRKKIPSFRARAAVAEQLQDRPRDNLHAIISGSIHPRPGSKSSSSSAAVVSKSSSSSAANVLEDVVLDTDPPSMSPSGWGPFLQGPGAPSWARPYASMLCLPRWLLLTCGAVPVQSRDDGSEASEEAVISEGTVVALARWAQKLPLALLLFALVHPVSRWTAGASSPHSQHTDAIYTLGCLAGLAALNYGSSFSRHFLRLEHHAQSCGFLRPWRRAAPQRFLVLGALCLCDLVVQVVGELTQQDTAQRRTIVALGSDLCMGSLVALLVYCHLHACCGLELMVERFYVCFATNPDCKAAVRAWTVIQGMLQQIMDDMDFSFLALQTSLASAFVLTGVGGAMAASESVGPHHVAVQASALLKLLMGFYGLRGAAAVKEKYTRAPLRVDSLVSEDADPTDPSAQHLVRYMTHSTMDFRASGIRVRTYTVIKVLCLSVTYALTAMWLQQCVAGR